ncbi:MAG: DUF1638 domain-containing protein [Anaerolineales bacterium]
MSEMDQLPIVVIACRVFQGLLDSNLPSSLGKEVTYLDYGLHRVPAKLTEAVQAQIDRIEEPSLVVLGYGLCGNGLAGVKSGQHTLLISRADDCIAILLGSYERYLQEFDSEPGTYYLTKGWLESGSNPLNEFKEYEERYGFEQAQWLMDQQYQHYKRLVLVAHSAQDLDKYRPLALEVAEYCQRWGMEYEEILGSERYVQRLVQAAESADPDERDFVLVPPGEEIRQEAFLSRGLEGG